MPSTLAYAAPPHTLPVVSAGIETTFYSTFALLIYDHLLTLSEEVQYVWWARWTIIKVVFLANRYISPAVIGMGLWDRSGLATGLTDRSCRAWLLAEYAMGHLILSVASFIMAFRLHAAWSKPSFFIFLGFIWISTNAASLTIGLMTLVYQRDFIYYEKTSNTCNALIPGLWKLYLPNVISHVAFLVVLLCSAFCTPRSSKSPILGILLKDGIIYCSVVLVALLQTVIIWAFVDWTNHLPFHIMWATCAGQVSRFLLSLKTVQSVLPFQRHGTSTANQIETSSGTQILSSTDELSQYKVRPNYNKAFPGPLTATSGEQQESTHQPSVGRFASFFRAPPRHRHVEVDADASSWWVEGEDRGPGMQESQIGRYDSWL